MLRTVFFITSACKPLPACKTDGGIEWSFSSRHCIKVMMKIIYTCRYKQTYAHKHTHVRTHAHTRVHAQYISLEHEHYECLRKVRSLPLGSRTHNNSHFLTNLYVLSMRAGGRTCACVRLNVCACSRACAYMYDFYHQFRTVGDLKNSILHPLHLRKNTVYIPYTQREAKRCFSGLNDDRV